MPRWKEKTMLERFEDKYVKQSSGCWEWQADKVKGGYGRMRIDGKLNLAHRVSHKLFLGDIPEGHVVRHKCDNASCVNPDHLVSGTPSDNMKDMAKAGRCWKQKLSTDGYDKIKQLRYKGESQKSLADTFNVSQSLISDICNNKLAVLRGDNK